MITNVNKSGCLNSTVDYVYRKDKDPMVLNANFCRSDKLGALGELREAINEKPHIKEPVWHAMLSLDKGEHLTNEQWQQATDEYIEKMGFSNCPFVVVKHHDTEHEHVHIIASRVSYDRQLVSDSFDYPRSQVAARDLEARFNLRSVPNSWDVGTRAQQQSEYNLTRRTGMQSSRSVMIDALRDSSKKQGVHSVVDLKRQLDAQHIKMVPKTTRDESKIVGVYFEHKGVRIPGSKLHKSFGWNRLQERFEYKAKRDQNILLGKQPVPQKSQPHAQPSVTQKPSTPTSPEIGIKALLHIKQGLVRADWDNGFGGWTASMEKQGVSVVPKVTQGDHQKITGIYFEYKGIQIPGSSIRKEFGFKGIEHRLGGYEPKRDYRAFKQVMIPGVGKKIIGDVSTQTQRVNPPTNTPKPTGFVRPSLGQDNISQRHQDVQAHPMLKNFVGEGTFNASSMTANEFVQMQRKSKQPWAMASDIKSGKWTVLSKDVVCKDGRFAVLVNEKHQAILLPHRRDVDVLRHKDVELTQTMQIKPVITRIEPYPINPMPDALKQYQQVQTKPTAPSEPPGFEQWAKHIKETRGVDVSMIKSGDIVRGKIYEQDKTFKEGKMVLIEQPNKKFVAVPRQMLEQATNKNIDTVRGKQIVVVQQGNDLRAKVQEHDRGMSR